MAGATFEQGWVQICWRAQHSRKVKFSQVFNCVAGAQLSKGQVQISWQARHFRKVKYRLRGRRSTSARSSTDLITFASLGTDREIDGWMDGWIDR